MKNLKFLPILGLLLFPQLAEAQTSRNPCYTSQGQAGQQPNCIGVGTSTPLPVTTGAEGLLVGTAGAPAVDVVTVQSPITLGSAGFPAASTPISGNASGSTGAVVGTLAANATKTTYICGFNVQSIGGVATSGPIVIAGIITGSQTYQTGVNSTTAGQVASASFTPCIPSSAINTAITITTTANGTATAVNVNSWGFQQ